MANSGIIRRAVTLIRAANRDVVTHASTRSHAGTGLPVQPSALELGRKVDLLLVFGGDGTFLRVAREVAGHRTPLLGVNIGSLGFLTAVSSSRLQVALDQVWAGDFSIESRALIEVRGRCNGHHVTETALNDIVISRGHVSRLIELEVAVNREPLTRYRCDGLIISSPTGSTAYSLAAGGALVFPTAEVLSMTPVAPHTLSNRSLIVPLRSKIQVKATSSHCPTVLSADGEVVADMNPGDSVTIRSSRRSVRLLRLADSSFFEALRRKLHLRGANV